MRLPAFLVGSSFLCPLFVGSFVGCKVRRFRVISKTFREKFTQKSVIGRKKRLKAAVGHKKRLRNGYGRL